MTESWNETESLFAPIVAGVPRDARWAGFGNTLYACAQSIPQATLPYRINPKGFKKSYVEWRTRRAITVTGDARKPHSAAVALADFPVTGPLSNYLGNRHWQAGVTTFKDGCFTPAIPADFSTAVFQVSRFRLDETGLIGGPQLALMRYLWAEAIKAVSPEAIVFGGQHHWNGSWWTEQRASE